MRRVELLCDCGYEWRYTAQPVAEAVSVNGHEVPPFLEKRARGSVLADLA